MKNIDPSLEEAARDMGYMPEQVQDFYPTPSTMSTCMYYTGVDPRTMEPIYVARDPHEKAMQRALIQYRKPENYKLVREALEKAGRRDLIGYSKHCLIRPVPPRPGETSAGGGHGAGNKGGALALAAAKKTGGDRLAVACSTRERSEAAAQRLGCTAETPQRILSASRFVFLGVKPQMVVGVVEGLKADILASEGIFVSMLAGVSLEKLALLLGADKKIIRIMPNTPCAMGQGLILYAANGRVSEDELCAFRELMAPAGALDELNEHLIDAASAVSGCGPAFVYLFLDALANGGVSCGLPYPQALALAAQTMIGAAAMALASGKHPG